ncbi:MAG TPA: LysM peptidoglycan-binding domain-containing protein [Anaerolineales bacterium]|nr:LysM peptidoglycan-binding domain-containing protein [Anaerolineales bacterium]
MTSETPSKPTKLCPTCGTRVSEDATRCLVCGSDLTAGAKSGKKSRPVQGSRMPEITLSLPIALVLLAVFLAIGATLVFFAMRGTGLAVEAAPTAATATVTTTATSTTTPTPVTPTPTDTPQPSPTPNSYTIQTGDTCAGIAFSFGVSIQSIVLLNNLPAECSPLTVGTTLLIPQPTPTPTSLPTSTLSAADATEQACGKEDYVVQENDTLSSIANTYNIPMAVIQEYNGLSSENVLLGMNLVIPLCERYPTPGPTPTATLPPPYTAPNLLLPLDGARFVQTGDTVTLQWASVGTLLENEAYSVNVVDITEGEDRKLIDYVTDTKFIVPASFRSTDSTPHIYRWWIVPSRQTGTDDDGNAVWEPAGAASSAWIYMWSGAGPGPAVTPTP